MIADVPRAAPVVTLAEAAETRRIATLAAAGIVDRCAARSPIPLKAAPQPIGGRAAKRAEKRAKRAVSLAGSTKVIEGTRLVDDPYEAGAKVAARVNLAEHPLEFMRARGRLSPAHYEAGARFRGLYERAAIGSARGIDPAKVKVDGGGAGDPLGVAVMAAHRELALVAGALGPVGSVIVAKVCGEGVCVAKLAETWPAAGGERGVRDYLTLRVAEALEVLAVDVWGATGGAGRAADKWGGAWGAAPAVVAPDVRAVDDAATAQHVRRFQRRGAPPAQKGA